MSNIFFFYVIPVRAGDNIILGAIYTVLRPSNIVFTLVPRGMCNMSKVEKLLSNKSIPVLYLYYVNTCRALRPPIQSGAVLRWSWWIATFGCRTTLQHPPRPSSCRISTVQSWPSHLGTRRLGSNNFNRKERRGRLSF